MLWLLRFDAEQAMCIPLFYRLDRDSFDEFRAAPAVVFARFKPEGNLRLFIYQAGTASYDPF